VGSNLTPGPVRASASGLRGPCGNGLDSGAVTPRADIQGPIGLFVPCYVDQLHPDVGLATLELLEGLGLEVEFPEAQTCCGQPMTNAGCRDAARPLAERFLDIFAGYEHVVCPSGSCVAMVRHHYRGLLGARAGLEPACGRVRELSEFLFDVLGLRSLPGRFPHRVGLHRGCHGLRELRLGRASELGLRNAGESHDEPARVLLEGLDGIELVPLDRPDECCGFGGSFAVGEAAVSGMMGRDRVDDHVRHGAEVVASADMSCLIHLDGVIRRQGRALPVMHVAQILAGRPLPGDAS